MITDTLTEARMHTLKRLSPTLMLILLLALPLAGCREHPAPAPAERPTVTGLRTETVEITAVPQLFEAAGTVRARTISRVAARVMGPVTTIAAEAGDRVKKGQILARIDDRDASARTRAAEAALDEARRALDSAREHLRLAETTLTRFTALHEERALSTQELDSAVTRRNVAQAEVARLESMTARFEASLGEARVYLGFTRVTAPVSGVVSERNVDEGSMATPGMPLFTVEDTSAYRLEVPVDERYRSAVTEEAEASVEVPSLGRTLAGTVDEIVPAVDPATRTFLVKIAVEGNGLTSGLYARARLVVGQAEALLVPASALVARGQLTGIFVVGEDRIISYRLVRVGQSHADRMVEILSGLRPGETIVVEGAERAVDGGQLSE
jgi:RND family efflux transporter MFP subunit